MIFRAHFPVPTGGLSRPLNGLGQGYEHADFQLPTTSMSRPLNASGGCPGRSLGCGSCRGCSGLGTVHFPNFAIAGPLKGGYRRITPRGAPVPEIYRPPEQVIAARGLGQGYEVSVPIGGSQITVGTQPIGFDLSTWLQNQWITGVPNWALAAVGLFWAFSGRGRR